MKQELLKKIDGVDRKVNKLDKKIDKVENNLTKRIDKIGKTVAYLEDTLLQEKNLMGWRREWKR